MKRFNIKALTYFVFLLVLGLRAEAQQNIQFTQYIFNSLSVNPAYAGYKEEWFGQMGLRAQWTGIEDAPRTGQLSVDGILDPDKKNMGLGLQITADKLGAQSFNTAYLNYAYRLPLNEDGSSRLAFGVGAGISQYGIDYGKLNPIDGTDAEVNRGSARSFVPDVRLGLHFSNDWFFAGVSVLDVFADTDLSSKLMGKDPDANDIIQNRRHMYFISGGVIDLNSDIKLRPSVLLKEDFKGPTSLDLNTMVIFDDRFWMGYSYRTGVRMWKKDYENAQKLSLNNSVGLIAQVFVKENLRIGYSYDYSLNKLSNLQDGSHEITLGYTLPKRIYRSLSPRYF